MPAFSIESAPSLTVPFPAFRSFLASETFPVASIAFFPASFAFLADSFSLDTASSSSFPLYVPFPRLCVHSLLLVEACFSEHHIQIVPSIHHHHDSHLSQNPSH